MRQTGPLVLASVAVGVTMISAGSAIAQQDAGHNHIGHVMDGWNDTPDGVGLLPAAIAEAEIAARHASLAVSDLTNLTNMKRHTVHVLPSCHMCRLC